MADHTNHQYDPLMGQGQWKNQTTQVAAAGYDPFSSTPVKQPPMMALGNSIEHLAESVLRLEAIADRLAGTRPEAVAGGLMGGGVPPQPAVAAVLNSHANALDDMARRMQSALGRIEQVFG